jgi:hypothetical protein
LLEAVLSNCTLDRGSLCPTCKTPFDLFAHATETGEWRAVWDDFRNCLNVGLQPAKYYENRQSHRRMALRSGEIDATHGAFEAVQLFDPERARLSE